MPRNFVLNQKEVLIGLEKIRSNREIKDKIHIYIAGVIAVIYVYISVWCLTWLVEYDRKWRWGY
jgi:hypothetical protein